MENSIHHTTRLLEGAPLAAEIKAEVARDVDSYRERYGRAPALAAVRVGDDPASAVYVANKIRACEEVGIRSEHLALPVETTEAELLALIGDLNAREDIDGILVQLPLPPHIHETAVIESVDPRKDVDGFHPVNVGRLALGHPQMVPCTPAGIIALLDYYDIRIAGAPACVIGRSQIVGRPVAQLLLQRDATVSICHSKTRDLAAVAREADILIVAIGRPGFVGRDFIKPGAAVIDVGMNQLTEVSDVRALFGADAERRLQVLSKRGYTLVGDVNPAEADEVAGSRSPVPAGVGLLTVAMLMRNTLKAAQTRQG